MDTQNPMANKLSARAWARVQQRGEGGFDPASWGQSSGEVWGIVRDHAKNGAGSIVMVYVPISGEPDPIVVASEAISAGWQVAVGRGTSRTSPLQVVRIEPSVMAGGRWDRDRCEPDAWGMAVPRDRIPVSASEVTAVLVPGMAFDRTGHRLGRGAGVYDRFLSTLPPTALRVGLVHSGRLVDRLPTDAHDVPMHVVATEREVIRTGTPG